MFFSYSAWTSTLAPRFNGDLSLETGLGSKAINIDFNAGFDGKPERLVFKKALSYELGEIEKMILGEFVVTIPFKVNVINFPSALIYNFTVYYLIVF